MRLSFLVAVVMVAATCKPLQRNAEHSDFLTKLLGEDFDLAIVNRIVAEEARSLGISQEAHFNQCYVEDQKEGLEFGELLTEGLEEFQAADLHFGDVDSAMEVLKEKSPKFHQAMTILYANMIAHQGKEATLYVFNLKQTLLEIMVNHFEIRDESESRRLLAKSIRTMYADYEAMSKDAQIDFEKKTCIWTAIRVYDKTGRAKGYMSRIKGNMDIIASQY